jgi:hypothetical protein
MSPFEPPPDFVDPRSKEEFEPEHWPLCDGKAAPPVGAAGLHERRCVEFLAAFYYLNYLNARLLAARSDGKQEVARPLVLAIAAATTDLERLEDRYAPIGFFGEPVMDGVRYESISFLRPEQPRLSRKASELTSLFAVGIQDIPESELRGPVRLIRYGKGKVNS